MLLSLQLLASGKLLEIDNGHNGTQPLIMVVAASPSFSLFLASQGAQVPCPQLSMILMLLSASCDISASIVDLNVKLRGNLWGCKLATIKSSLSQQTALLLLFLLAALLLKQLYLAIEDTANTTFSLAKNCYLFLLLFLDDATFSLLGSCWFLIVVVQANWLSHLMGGSMLK